MKAIACDFDGTLRFHGEDGSYSREEDIKAIRKFQEEGNLFGICSGRPLNWLIQDLGDLPKPDFLITSTGAMVTLEGEMCVCHSFSRDLAGMIIHSVKNPKYVLAQAAGEIYVWQLEKGNRTFQSWIKEEDLPEMIEDVSLQFESDEEAAQVTKILKEKFPELAPYQNTNSIDIVKAGVSKGTGIEDLKKLLPISVMGGIGDSFNDIPLIDCADIGFTFHASEAEVKGYADHLVGSVAEAVSIMLSY